jgi:DNA-binding transcriptional MerR regulator
MLERARSQGPNTLSRDTTYEIGEAARATGMSVHTLRYYERIGLIAPVRRLPNGRRAYTDDDLWWLGFVAILATTGMPIREMVAFVRLERAGDESLAERRAILRRRRAAVQAAMRRLNHYREAIERKLEHYAGRERPWQDSSGPHR